MSAAEPDGEHAVDRSRGAARLQTFLDELIAQGHFSAVTALVGTADGIEWAGWAGLARRDAGGPVPAGPGTVYDFGSLAKPLVATLALVLDAAGLLSLRLPLGEVFPAARRGLVRQPLAELLRHRARVAAWAPLYVLCRSPQEVLDFLLSGALSGGATESGPAPSAPSTLVRAPSGTYSDLGYLLWGFAAERVLGRSLADLLAAHVLGPLGLSSIVPPPGDRPEVAEHLMGTGVEVALARAAGLAIADLGPPAIGATQDGNARFLFSRGFPVCGHAGLFGAAGDLLRLGQEWLEPGRLLQPVAVAAALAGRVRRKSLGTLGWWSRQPEDGAGGAALSPGSFGHTGFPGGNLWIDPRTGRVLVLLGHRLDPFGPINERRRAFHALVYDELGLRPGRPRRRRQR